VTDNRPLIEVCDLHHTYAREGSGPVTALRNVTMQVRWGEFIAVVGANGSGKTTLARHLNGLLLPGSGSVIVNGLDTREQSLLPTVRSQVAMVFQRPEDQIVATTVEDDVAFGPENLGLASDEIAARVQWALEAVGLGTARKRPPNMLSAGQQQRVAIAGALAMRPSCLVLDEATAMLDPLGRRELLTLIQSLHAQGTAIILVTHRMNEAAQAERLIALDEGQIAFDGTPREFFSEEARVAALGLELPPLMALGARLIELWPDFDGHAATVHEMVNALLPFLNRSTELPTLPDACRGNVQQQCGAGLCELEGIDLRYTYLPATPLAATALDGVSLRANRGSVVSLIGPTGSGKSTFLQHAAALLRPQSGRVLLRGRDVHDLSFDRRALRDQVSLLFQRSEEQLFETYVGDDVAFGPRQLGLDRDGVRDRVIRAMEEVGLPFKEFKDRFTQSLSGGERRKAALAGVLAMQPELLLLDEPTSGLDPQARRSVLNLLGTLNRTDGVTLVVATHSMEDVAELADWAYVLDGGRCVGGGSARCVLSRIGLLESHSLEPPAVTSLMQRLRSHGVPVPPDILSLQEAATCLNRVRSVRQ